MFSIICTELITVSLRQTLPDWIQLSVFKLSDRKYKMTEKRLEPTYTGVCLNLRGVGIKRELTLNNQLNKLNEQQERSRQSACD